VVLNDRQYAWALREMRKDILESPDWQRLSDEEKQKSAERAIQMTMSVVGYTSIAALSMAGMQARRNLESLFSPRKFDEYKLADDGFEKMSKTESGKRN
jgi:hypothetical protein